MVEQDLEVIQLKREIRQLRDRLHMLESRYVKPFTETLHLNPVYTFRLKRSPKGFLIAFLKEHTVSDLEKDEDRFRNMNELFSEHALADWIPFIEEAFEGKISTLMTHYNKHSFYTTLIPITDHGNVIEVIGTSVDVKHHFFVQDQDESKFKELFKNALDAFILLNDDRQIIDVNPAACKLFGRAEDDLLMQKLDPFFDGVNCQKSVSSYWKELFQEEKLIGECQLRHRSGEIKHIHFTCKKDIHPGIHLAIFHDVTRQRETEEKLRKAETLNVVGELAAGVAHEIRNPLTSLKGFIQLIKAESNINESYFSIVLGEVDRIEHIIKEFLLLAKTDRNHLEKNNLGETLKDTVSLLRTQAILKNVDLFLGINEPLPEIYCDSFQIKQVFINLIKNAIEATPEGGTIEITATMKGDDSICFTFKDSGVGMNKEVLEKIGQPFFTTKEEGTGLGLMVSHKIIKNHKGMLYVTSEKGKGTTFELLLPVRQKEPTVTNW